MLKGLFKPMAILFVLAQVLALVPPVPALAQEPVPDVKPPAPDVTVVSVEQMSALAEIAVQSEQYLQVRSDGTLTLKLDDPATLGVEREFLDAYRAGLEEINALVRAGELTIKDDLSVAWTKELPADEAADEKAPAEQPDWGAWPYSSGVTIYFNHAEAGRFRHHGLSYATTLGAFLRRPYTVGYYTYLFTRPFNHRVFGHHRYSYGTYFYTPWSHYRGRHYYKSIYFYRYYHYRPGGYWVSSRVYY